MLRSPISCYHISSEAQVQILSTSTFLFSFCSFAFFVWLLFVYGLVRLAIWSLFWFVNCCHCFAEYSSLATLRVYLWLDTNSHRTKCRRWFGPQHFWIVTLPTTLRTWRLQAATCNALPLYISSTFTRYGYEMRSRSTNKTSRTRPANRHAKEPVLTEHKVSSVWCRKRTKVKDNSVWPAIPMSLLYKARVSRDGFLLVMYNSRTP